MLKTIQITVPEQLLVRIDEFVANAKMTRSGFIRRAVEEELRRARIAEMERLDREAYERQPVTEKELEELALWESAQDWGDPWPNP